LFYPYLLCFDPATFGYAIALISAWIAHAGIDTDELRKYETSVFKDPEPHSFLGGVLRVMVLAAAFTGIFYYVPQHLVPAYVSARHTASLQRLQRDVDRFLRQYAEDGWISPSDLRAFAGRLRSISPTSQVTQTGVAVWIKISLEILGSRNPGELSPEEYKDLIFVFKELDWSLREALKLPPPTYHLRLATEQGFLKRAA
jgi:hypothetical protein